MGNFWKNVFEVLSKALHSITGFIVHPKAGGCCYKETDDDLKNK